MAIKPILFSTPMVQAILDGRKTQTRRIIDVDSNFEYRGVIIGDGKRNGNHLFIIGPNKWTEIKPKYQPGDILWVRETWQQEAREFENENGKGWVFTGKYIYRADGAQLPIGSEAFGKWKLSIHMPKEAARIFLKVTDVRVEKLQDISAKDAIAEGVESRLPDCGIAQSQFQVLWQSIHGSDSWHSNPYVWVYSFEKVDRPVNFLTV